MPGRKHPEPTESERTREYRLMQKRERGEKVVGDEAEFLDDLGAAGAIRREREERG